MPKTSLLNAKLANVRAVFDIERILDLDTSPKQIARYYRINRLAYWAFVSRRGFVHMGLSKGQHLRPEDFGEPARQISKHIASSGAKTVLELATGKGANTQYLARRHPDVSFYALDLPHGQTGPNTFRRLQNVEFNFGDYHDLSNYDADSMDIVFIVEALCYAQPKPKVISEVYRVLKPGGLFIIYDGYNLKQYSDMSDVEATMVRIGWKGMSVNPDDMLLADCKKYLKQTGFKIIQERDLGQAILPSLRMLEKPARKFFHHHVLARMISKILPITFTANAISGYVMPAGVESGLCTYNLMIGQK